MNSIKGKIVNHDNSFLGEIVFDNKIREINNLKSLEEETFIIPGFVDLHCHGGNNSDVMGGVDEIIKMSNFHLGKGTTSLLPTTWTSTFEKTYRALENFDTNFLNNFDTNIMGVHLEGPFINPNKLGAQPAFTQKPNIEFINEIEKVAKIKIITLAPEIEGAEKFIDDICKKNIKVQIGHSLADYGCCISVMNKYSIGFTHLYNAMSGNDHRKPGVLSAALDKGKYAEIICDFNHVSEQAIKIASKCIPNIYAITDSILAAGMPDGVYYFANTKIIKKNNQVRTSSNILAGSIINMHDTFKNLLKINFSIQEAVSMTSYNAAQYIQALELGRIKKDCYANFLVLDKELNIIKIFLYGRQIK